MEDHYNAPMKSTKRFFLTLIALLPLAVHAGNFKLSPESSTLGVNGKASPPHAFTSMATAFTVDIQIDPETLEVKQATCSFPFEKMDSEEAKRDTKMCKWMEVDHYPEGRFKLSSVRREGDQWIATGSFMMHGLSREIDVPFSIHKEGETVIIDGESEFDTTDWGLDKIRLFIFTVKPTVRPFFHLEGTLAAAES
jgi:polyisoprenoid-binding protein YceI